MMRSARNLIKYQKTQGPDANYEHKENDLKFVSLEVKGVADHGDYCSVVEDDADADFFSLYGRDEDGFAHCIGDFADRAGADSIKAALKNG